MLPEKMKGIVITDAQKAEVKELSMPVPVAGEVLVKIEKCMICTWEQRIFHSFHWDIKEVQMRFC